MHVFSINILNFRMEVFPIGLVRVSMGWRTGLKPSVPHEGRLHYGTPRPKVKILVLEERLILVINLIFKNVYRKIQTFSLLLAHQDLYLF